MIEYRKYFGWGSQRHNGKTFAGMIETILKIKQNKTNDTSIDVLNIPTFAGRVLSILVNELETLDIGEMNLRLTSCDPYLYAGKNDAERSAGILFGMLEQMDQFEYPFLKKVKIEKGVDIDSLTSKKYDAILISRVDIEVTNKVLDLLPSIAKENAVISIDFEPIDQDQFNHEEYELKLIQNENTFEGKDHKSIYVYQFTRRNKPKTKNQKVDSKEIVNVLSQNKKEE